jgi:hypothetical protein
VRASAATAVPPIAAAAGRGEFIGSLAGNNW